MYLTIRSSSGIKTLKRGQIYKVLWTFTPKCGKGSCRTRVDISSLSNSLSISTIELKRKGAGYKRAEWAALFRCVAKVVPGRLTINLRVSKGAWVENEWKAAQIAGTLRHSAGAARFGGFRCRGGTLSAGLKGWLLE